MTPSPTRRAAPYRPKACRPSRARYSERTPPCPGCVKGVIVPNVAAQGYAETWLVIFGPGLDLELGRHLRWLDDQVAAADLLAGKNVKHGERVAVYNLGGAPSDRLEQG